MVELGVFKTSDMDKLHSIESKLSFHMPKIIISIVMSGGSVVGAGMVSGSIALFSIREPDFPESEFLATYTNTAKSLSARTGAPIINCQDIDDINIVRYWHEGNYNKALVSLASSTFKCLEKHI